jgi:hypothetical protein
LFARKRALSLIAVLGLVWSLVGAEAVAGPNAKRNLRSTDDRVVDSPVEAAEARDHQHGGEGGHLPGSSKNVELVGKLDTLTEQTGGISDVNAFGKYAYLGAFSPECVARGGAGTGVHVVDISDPANPTKVGFIPAHPNSYVGEGVQVIHAQTPFFTGDILIHNNEACDSSQPHYGGVSLWNVTNPLAPVPLAQGVGDNTPPKSPNINGVSTSHSAFGWWVPEAGKAYVMLVDNQEFADVDILDITNPTTPVQISETGFADWPDAHAPLANGDTVFHHDMQIKKIEGHWRALVSYWDAGWVILNVDDPANPVFVDDTDYPTPDPLTGFEIPEGNGHQAWYSSNNEFILGTDEDFSPNRTDCAIETGPNAGPTGCGEFGWTIPLTQNFPGGLLGTTVWGGSGCVEDLDGNGKSDRQDAIDDASADKTGADIIVFRRGVCFFSIKVETGQMAGYKAVIIGNSHLGSRGGLVPDAFFCGGQGHEYDKTASGICIGHRGMHLLFDDEPNYSGGEFVDLPAVGTLGHDLSALGGVFDGWGYVHLINAQTLEEIDAYAVAEGLDPDFASGFGNLTVHEVETDPRANVKLAYLSYYDAGFRVVKFGKKSIREVGHFIDVNGNDFWGIVPVQKMNPQGKPVGAPLLLLSDRDSGLWIFRYTGD